jgi:hypothetical protein
MTPESAPITRTPTRGPELRLIRQFARQALPRSTSREEVTVFVEPKLDNGYPDLVVVYWDKDVAASWPEARARLTSDDVMFLQYLHHVRREPIRDLRTRVGKRRADAIVEHLIDADAVRCKGAALQRRRTNEVFAVRGIVAIEAKVTNWRKGLQQAFLNTWFASESHLLLPSKPSASAIKRAVELGVGVITLDHSFATPLVKPRRDRLPRSYASWIFNEWVWRGRGQRRS